MATILKAGNVASGAQITSDSTGILEIKTGTGAGTTAITVGTDQAVTFAAGTTVSSLTTSGAVSAGSLTVNSNNISAVNSLGFRNRIINGAMVIDQRNNGASVSTGTSTNIYTVDRWQAIYAATSKYTVQRNAGSVTPPANFVNYLGVTSSSAYTPGASEYFSVRQMIEGFNVADLNWGSANAVTVTLSFWVRSSLTGTFGGAIVNGASAGGENRSYPFSYTISSANTWTQISLTIPGDTTGTWATDNTGGIQVRFGLGAGSSFVGTSGSWQAGNFIQPTGTVSVVGTNGATFYITGVQLEAGSVATPFERRDYGRELIMCQRYCYVWSNTNATDPYQRVTIASVGESSSSITSIVQFPVRMRANVSFTPSGSFQAYSGAFLTPTNLPVFASSSGGSYADNMCFVLQFSSGVVAGQAYHVLSANNNNSKIIYSAEL